MSIDPTQGSSPKKETGRVGKSTGSPQSKGPTTELVAEGLDASQIKQLLTQLKSTGKINGIGTPSREEMVNPQSVGAGARALGGFFQGGPMDSIMVDMTTQLISERDNTDRFDISITRMPMGENSMGIQEAAIAQVYPSDAKTEAISHRDFGSLMVRVDYFDAPRQTAARLLNLAVNETPTRVVELGKDLSFGELAIRLKSLVNNNRVNVILSPATHGSDDQAKTTTRLEDEVESHLKRVKAAANGDASARYSIAQRNYSPKGLGGELVAAFIDVERKSTPTNHSPSIDNLTSSQGELVAEGLDAKGASDVLKVLWNDRKLDTLGIGSYKLPPNSVIFPSAGFKDDSGSEMSVDELFEQLMSRHSNDFPGKKLDVILSGNSPCKRDENDRPVQGEGFLARVYADDFS